MKKTLAWITITGLLVCSLPTVAFAAPVRSGKDTDKHSDQADEPAADEDSEEAEKSDEGKHPDDNTVTTKHTVTIKGEEVSYTAEAGTMVVESGGKTCEIFFTSYTRNDIDDDGDRPITFAFNGGPGASSYCIQFGCLGPRKPELDETGYALTLPAKIIDNEGGICSRPVYGKEDFKEEE